MKNDYALRTIPQCYADFDIIMAVYMFAEICKCLIEYFVLLLT